MTLNDSCLYVATHKIPIYHRNGFMEERQLNSIISDNGERIVCKIILLTNKFQVYSIYFSK